MKSVSHECGAMVRLFSLCFLTILLLSPFSVSAANLIGLSLSPQNPALNVGASVQLTATGSYDDGTQQVITQAKQVSAGVNHTCALGADSTVQCWGFNPSGQLGNGTTANSTTPLSVSGINNAVAVSAGASHTCAVLTDGTLRCWGG